MYYGISFVEERIEFVTKFLKRYTTFVLILSLFLPFVGFPAITYLPIIGSNAMWLNFFYNGFPFISFARIDFILAIFFALVAHCGLIYTFISIMSVGSFLAIAYYILYVWGIPLIVIVSLSSLEDSNEHIRTKPKSIWENFFKEIITYFRQNAPISPRKYE